MRSAWLAVLLAGVCTSAARADEIMFKNGDRLSGTIVSLVEGRMKFRSELAGDLEFAASELDTFATAEPITMHLKDGTVLVDAVQSDDPGTVRTQGAGEVVVNLAETTAINPPVQKPNWSGSLAAGTTLERGNTEKDAGYIDVKGRYDRGRSRLSFRFSYDGERTKNKSTGDSTTIDRNLYGLLDYEYLLTKKLFWFVTTTSEKDGPSELNLRYVAGAGPGIRWFDREDFVISTRLGLTWTSENYSGTDRDDDYVGALLRWEVERQLLPRVGFFHSGLWLPSLKDFNDRQLWKVETGIRTDITSSVFLETKAIWELDTEPAAGTERQDVDYIFALGYQF
jgi:putative salt-induced outer membrane protein YdiY